jgi:predicted membrane channel-forming protein YqfA (hemolysin III family)
MMLAMPEAPITLRYDERPLRGFLIHLGVYVLVVATLVALNVLTNPAKLWSLWVLAGWGIGVAAHDLVLLLKTSPRRQPLFQDKRTRGFAVHAFVYVAVILLLLVVNLVATPNNWWFYWVALGWGAGLALHGWLAFGRDRP